MPVLRERTGRTACRGREACRVNPVRKVKKAILVQTGRRDPKEKPDLKAIRVTRATPAIKAIPAYRDRRASGESVAPRGQRATREKKGSLVSVDLRVYPVRPANRGRVDLKVIREIPGRQVLRVIPVKRDRWGHEAQRGKKVTRASLANVVLRASREKQARRVPAAIKATGVKPEREARRASGVRPARKAQEARRVRRATRAKPEREAPRVYAVKPARKDRGGRKVRKATRVKPVKPGQKETAAKQARKDHGA